MSLSDLADAVDRSPEARRDRTKVVLAQHKTSIAELSRRSGVPLQICYDLFRNPIRMTNEKYNQHWSLLEPFLQTLADSEEEEEEGLSRPQCLTFFSEFLSQHPLLSLESIAKLATIRYDVLEDFQDQHCTSMSDEMFDSVYNRLVPLINAEPGSRFSKRMAEVESDEERKLFKEWLERNPGVVMSAVAREIAVPVQDLEAYRSLTGTFAPDVVVKIREVMDAHHWSLLGRRIRTASSKKRKPPPCDDVEPGKRQKTVVMPNNDDVVDVVSRLIKNHSGVKVTVFSIQF